MTTEEPLVSLIKISRVLLASDKQQLTKFIPDIVQIFNESNQIKLLQQIFHKGLTSFYKQIPQIIYQQIQAVAPTKLSIKDSITDDADDDNKQNDDDNKLENKTLIKLPKDLLLHCMNFLLLTDIYNLSSLCRYLCVICHDHNAVYHINIEDKKGFIHYKDINRYKRAKSLNIWDNGMQIYMDKELAIQTFNNWRHLQSLHLDTNNYYVSDIIQSIPPNTELLTFKSSTSISINSLFCRLNPEALTSLGLHIEYNMTNEEFKVLTKAKNIKQLSLHCSKRNEYLNGDPPNLNVKSLLSNKNYNGKSYPFPSLEDVEINSCILTHSLYKHIFIWIMTNGIKQKILRWNEKSHLEEDMDNTLISILPNVKELYCSIRYNEYSRNFLSNINEYYAQCNPGSLNHFELKIDTTEDDVDVFKLRSLKHSDTFSNVYRINNMTKQIVSKSNSSHLICHGTNINVDILKGLLKDCTFHSISLYLINIPLCFPSLKHAVDQKRHGYGLYSVCTEAINDKTKKWFDIIEHVVDGEMNIGKKKSFFMELKHSHKYFVYKQHGVSVSTADSVHRIHVKMERIHHKINNPSDPHITRSLLHRWLFKEPIKQIQVIKDGVEYGMINNDKCFRFQCQINDNSL